MGFDKVTTVLKLSNFGIIICNLWNLFEIGQFVQDHWFNFQSFLFLMILATVAEQGSGSRALAIKFKIITQLVLFSIGFK